VATASQAQIAFSSDPAPPRKGSNRVRVSLTAAGGALLAGAHVTATFFMAAMPAMGMAAARLPVTLTERGNGVYEGTAQLPSGGTWQVTIVATKNGQTLATRALSVQATGGM
jgi:Cu(I)/Ag(I) efflux system membrane fusion protein/cobalt-zinc-cadmium efflux system membrane fusion protein